LIQSASKWISMNIIIDIFVTYEKEDSVLIRFNISISKIQQSL